MVKYAVRSSFVPVDSGIRRQRTTSTLMDGLPHLTTMRRSQFRRKDGAAVGAVFTSLFDFWTMTKVNSLQKCKLCMLN